MKRLDELKNVESENERLLSIVLKILFRTKV